MKNIPIREFSHLQSIKEEWNEIHAQSSLKSPLLSFEFLELWYKSFAAPDEVRIYRAIDGERIVGYLPLVLLQKGPVRILSGLTNDHCFHSEPLVLKGYETAFPKLILKELLHDWRNWDVFWHSFSYSFSQLPGLFTDDLLEESNSSWERRIQPTYTVSLNKSFEEYFRRDLPSNTRKNFMRFKNRLAKAGSRHLGYYEGADAMNLWPDFVRIENSGWKGKAQSSIMQTAPNFQKYYDGLVKLLADRKALRMYFLELDGGPISGVFGYIEGDIFHWSKTGYDEEFKKFSPSNLLLVYIIEDLIANFPQIRKFHMFPWDYNYKHRYANEDSFCIETILYSNTIRGKASQLCFKGKQAVKPFLKRVISS